MIELPKAFTTILICSLLPCAVPISRCGHLRGVIWEPGVFCKVCFASGHALCNSKHLLTLFSFFHHSFCSSSSSSSSSCNQFHLVMALGAMKSAFPFSLSFVFFCLC